MAYTLGGKVVSADKREYRPEPWHTLILRAPLFRGLPQEAVSWMSHTDYIEKLPDGFQRIAYTETCPAAAIQNVEKKLYGLQYHPEVMHTENGLQMIHNFLYEVCGCTDRLYAPVFPKSVLPASTLTNRRSEPAKAFSTSSASFCA